ncbi:flagellar protein export ATPase FliI [Bryobacterales bacterium F-183]|nr:flagellar protein export ATPase FliI [Bryobacterales bacterium F-183]
MLVVAMREISLDRYFTVLDQLDPVVVTGRVSHVTGLLIESLGPGSAVGGMCHIQTADAKKIRAQVIGFRDGNVLSMPLEEPSGIRLGDTVVASSDESQIRVGDGLMGRILDGFGNPMDGGPPIATTQKYSLERPTPGPLEREPIDERLTVGVRAIDSLLPLGRGQRMGIFGGSGVGKSTLLAALARQNDADVTVIAMIGERNREVRDFLEKELSPEGLAKSVVVVATSDQPAPLRIRAAQVALSISEYFRDQGKDVLFIMDSVTRLAMAQREIGLTAGEPPSQKGYTPSVFAMLPKICERAGRFRKGSITGLFTVLVEGDDFNEPICDAVRGILDGHLILSRDLGAAGHYPAIDILHSVSRLASRLMTAEEQAAARKIREALMVFRQSEDLINLGAYVGGSNPKLDSALRARQQMNDFLRQGSHEVSSYGETAARMEQLAAVL